MRSAHDFGMKMVAEFHSKLVGAECRVFRDRVEVVMPARAGQPLATGETVKLEEIRRVAVASWSGVSVANLMIHGQGGAILEVRMLPVEMAQRAKKMITGLTDELAAENEKERQKSPAA